MFVWVVLGFGGFGELVVDGLFMVSGFLYDFRGSREDPFVGVRGWGRQSPSEVNPLYRKRPSDFIFTPARGSFFDSRPRREEYLIPLSQRPAGKTGGSIIVRINGCTAGKEVPALRPDFPVFFKPP